MNQLDASKDAKANPDKLDFVKSGSRIDLLENKVVLVTPEGNPKGVQNFNDMAAKLKDGPSAWSWATATFLSASIHRKS